MAKVIQVQLLFFKSTNKFETTLQLLSMLYAVYLRTKLYGTTYAAYKFHGVGVFGSIEPHTKNTFKSSI